MILGATFLALVFLFSLISGRLAHTVITPAILFTGAGIIGSLTVPELAATDLGRSTFLMVAEIGLVMTLFGDATRIGLRSLRGQQNLSARLLGIGMLPTILLGAAAAKLVLPGLSLLEAGILGAILAPTDAGLGQVIVSSPQVPTRIRQALNVEAGLNDGLSVPFLMFFLALAVGQAEGTGAGVLTEFMVQQLGYGALIGGGVGLIGGGLLGLACRREWVQAPFQQLGLVALPALCIVACEATGASMFIAAFVAGLTVQGGFKDAGTHAVEFTEDWGQLLNFFVFFLFGVLTTRVWADFDLRLVVYAVLSLTLVRMLPVALSLWGTGLSRPTVLFMGWFGPRGLASIVLGLVYLELEAKLPGEPIIRLAVIITVLLSIFVHGLSALPGINLYAGRIADLGASAPEREGNRQEA